MGEKLAVYLPQLTSTVHITQRSCFLPLFSYSLDYSYSCLHIECLTRNLTTAIAHTAYYSLFVLPIRNTVWRFGALDIFHPQRDLSRVFPSTAALLNRALQHQFVPSWHAAQPTLDVAQPLPTNSWSQESSESFTWAFHSQILLTNPVYRKALHYSASCPTSEYPNAAAFTRSYWKHLP